MLLLDIKNLTIELKTPDALVRAVDRVNLSLREGEIRGLVGESGSGKSLIAKAIVGVLNKRWQVTADRFSWRGQDLLNLSYDEQRKIIGRDIAMIYQEPSRSLDPTAAILEQLEEAVPDHLLDGPWWKRSYLRRRKGFSGRQAWEAIIKGGSHAGPLGGFKQNSSNKNLVTFFWPEVEIEAPDVARIYGLGDN